MVSTPSESAKERPWRRLSQDLLAGLSLAGLLLPEAVAYAGIGNLPPQAGLIALFCGLIGYGIFGASRLAIVSATSSSAAVLAAACIAQPGMDAALRSAFGCALILMCGLFFVVAGLARLGRLTDLIAKPVLRGFSFGLALVIIVRQFAESAGIHAQPGQISALLWRLTEHIGAWNWPGITLCGAALLALKLIARFTRLPAAFTVIVGGIACTEWLDLAHYGIAVTGEFEFNWALPALPALTLDQWVQAAELGVALALIIYAESYASIRTISMGRREMMRPNRDLMTLGAVNIVSALFHGMPAGAGYSATMANQQAGAQSRAAGLTAALTAFLMLLIFAPALAKTPQPVLAAVIIDAVGHMLNPAIFRPYFVWKRDRLIIVFSVLGVLSLGVINGLLAAIALSVALMLRRLAQSDLSTLGLLGDGPDFVDIARHPEAKAVPGILILRPEEPLFFANAERILHSAAKRLRAAKPTPHSIIISLEESTDLDSTSLEALRDFIDDMAGRNVQPYFAHLKAPAQAILQQVFSARLAPQHFSELSEAEVVHLAQHKIIAATL